MHSNDRLTLLSRRLFPTLAVLAAVVGPPDFAANAQGGDAPETLTVWLVPTLPAATLQEGTLDDQIGDLREELNAVNVELLNVTQPDLIDQLRSPHPDFAIMSWPLIAGQRLYCWNWGG